MGTTSSSTRKGVSFDKDGAIDDCLFCRIIEGREPGGAPLWFKDSRVAAFVPRSPAARLHFLVVPLQHRTNVGDLAIRAVRRSRQRQDAQRNVELSSSSSPTSIEDGSSMRVENGAGADESLDLLRHMGRVARFLLREHGDLPALSRCAAPPRALAIALPPQPDERVDEGHVLEFHRLPYNSINHLHLHALKLPMASFGDSITFWRGAPWCGDLEDVLQDEEQAARACRLAR